MDVDFETRVKDTYFAEGESAIGIAEPGGARPIVSTFTPPAAPILVGIPVAVPFPPAPPVLIEPDAPETGRGILAGAPPRSDGVTAGASGPTVGAPGPEAPTIPVAAYMPTLSVAPGAAPAPAADDRRRALVIAVAGALVAGAVLWAVLPARRRREA